jgi:hypothetical protein
MRTYILFLLCTIAVLPANGQTTVLRHHEPEQATFAYPAGFQEFVARFEPEYSGFISAIVVQVNGPANGEFELSMYGHEGGTAFPQFEQPLFAFVTLNKKSNGIESIRYDFPEPIEVRNTQFFVVVKNLSNGVQLMSDMRPAESSCNSNSGGNYYFQYLKTSNANWTIGIRKAFAVSVLIDYSHRAETPWLKDVTSEWHMDSMLSNRSMACSDINRDGMLDLLVGGQLYLNDGKGHFKLLNEGIGYKRYTKSKPHYTTNRWLGRPVLFHAWQHFL